MPGLIKASEPIDDWHTVRIPSVYTMPPYLTDADVWRCVCAARLAELDHGDGKLTAPDYDGLAQALYEAHAGAAPLAAAAEFHRTQALNAA